MSPREFALQRRPFRPKLRRSAIPYLFLAPVVLSLLVFTYLPILTGIRLSLTDATFGDSGRFVGLRNFQDLLVEPRFWRIFYQTLVWTVFSVVGAVAAGVAVALALQRSGKRSGLMRGVVLLPWVASPVVVVYIWRELLSPIGPISPYLASSGITSSPPAILTSAESVLGISVAMMAVIALGVWSGLPFVYIFALSALSAIPREVLEAARVDGASATQSFRYIIWPLIRPVVATAAVLLSLVRFGGLDIPFLLTGGGPGDASSVLGVWIYNTAFASHRAGAAAAMGVLILVLMLPLSFTYVRMALRLEKSK